MIYTMSAIIVLISALVGGWLYRWHGGGWGINGPRWLQNTLLGLPFFLTPVFYAGLNFLTVPTSALCGGEAITGVATGHGRGQSLKEPMKPGDAPEKVEIATLWAQKFLPVYWYKALILLACGLLITAGSAISFAVFGRFLSATLCLSGGVGTPIGYMIGWKIYPTGTGKGISPSLCQATQIGEFLSGFFLFGFFSLAMELS